MQIDKDDPILKKLAELPVERPNPDVRRRTLDLAEAALSREEVTSLAARGGRLFSNVVLPFALAACAVVYVAGALDALASTYGTPADASSAASLAPSAVLASR